MKYCSNCGQQVSDTAKFCESCGHILAGSSETNKRHQEYAGSIFKCPNCGEILDAFEAVCPSCGYELRGAKASNSVQEFARKLEQIQSQRSNEFYNADRMNKEDEQVISLISSFPVPNTKEDLFEFVSLAASNIDVRLLDDTISNNDPKKAICLAWKAKLEQVYNKSIMLFSENDSRFLKISRVYNQVQGQIKKQERKQTTKFTMWVVLSLSGSIISLVLFAIVVFLQMNRTSMNTSMIELLAGAVLIITAVIAGKTEAGLISSLGVMGVSIILICLAIVAEAHMNTSMIEICAVISLIIAVKNLLKLVIINSRLKNKG